MRLFRRLKKYSSRVRGNSSDSKMRSVQFEPLLLRSCCGTLADRFAVEMGTIASFFYPSPSAARLSLRKQFSVDGSAEHAAEKKKPDPYFSDRAFFRLSAL